MADYCKNSLKCNKNLAEKILVPNEKEEGKLQFNFCSLVPPPREYLESYYMTNEMNRWFADNWGTNRNAQDCSVKFNKKDNTYTINFLTAWTIPRPIIRKLSEICGEDDFVWIAICEGSPLLEIFTKNEHREYQHHIDYYSDNAFKKMQEYLTKEATKKIEKTR